jgi:methionine synthase II (cobalamin-independent)
MNKPPQFIPDCLATGIGSLPFHQPQAALNLILESFPQVPHWPQLPRRGSQEGFVFQFLNPLVQTGLLELKANQAYFTNEHSDWPERLTEFYRFYLAGETGEQEALKIFSFPPEAAVGFYAFIETIKKAGTGQALYFKGQLAGPVTLGLQVKDASGNLAYYDPQLRDILVKTLALHARWQTNQLMSLGRPPIIFIDEPAISIYGQSGYITVTKEMIISDLTEIIQAVNTAGGRTGVHSCAALDWTILFETHPDIVNLDAYNYGHSLLPYTKELKDFLARDGVIAWGITPTSEKTFSEDVFTLTAKLQALWSELTAKGADQEVLKRQAMITPACGAGLLEPALAQHIYRLTCLTAKHIKGY